MSKRRKGKEKAYLQGTHDENSEEELELIVERIRRMQARPSTSIGEASSSRPHWSVTPSTVSAGRPARSSSTSPARSSQHRNNLTGPECISPAQLVRFKKIEKMRKIQEQEKGTQEHPGSPKRTGQKRKKSDSERAVSAAAKQKGKRQRIVKSRNESSALRCSTCVAAGIYDEQIPHSSRRHHLCPQHKEGPNEIRDQILGKDRQTFVKKIGLQTALRLAEDKNLLFCANVTELVNFWREVAIKTQCFVHYFVLDCFESSRPLTAIMFSQLFFYSAIQLVVGREITSKNTKIPKDDMMRCFAQYTAEFPTAYVQEQPGFMHALTSLAEQSASVFRNSVIETFENRVLSFFRYKLQAAIQDISKKDARILAEFVYNTCNHPANPPDWPSSITRSDEVYRAIEGLRQTFTQVATPVNEETLSASPEKYLPFLFFILQEIEQQNLEQVQLAETPQVSASRGWAYFLIKSLPEFAALSRRYRSRLVARIVDAVNTVDRRTPRPPLRIERLSEQSLARIRTEIEQAKRQINNSAIYHELGPGYVDRRSCFLPESSTVVKRERAFSIVPSYQLRRQFATIDIQTLTTLLIRSGVSRRPGQRDTIDHQTRQFADVFNFNSVRFNILSQVDNDREEAKEMFTNAITTDGYAVNFLFSRKKHVDESLPQLELNDFSTNELGNIFELWGADPGLNEIFVASNGHGEQPHQIRKFSTAEFYALAGRHKTTTKMLAMKQCRNEATGLSFEDVESQLPTRKTSKKSLLMIHLHALFAYFDQFLNFYDERFSSLRFLDYIGKQRAEAELINVFLDGGKKYNHRSLKTKRRKHNRRRKKKRKEKKKQVGKKRKATEVPQKIKKWRKAPHDRMTRFPLVAFGDAQFNQTMRGKKTGLANRCRKLLRRAERQGLLVTVDIWEFNTSKVCSRCHTKTLEKLRLNANDDMDDGSLHSVLQCTNCHTVWQRDINASRNMHCIASLSADGQERPVVFRPSPPSA